MSDDTVSVYVESARNGAQINRLGKKVISRQELRDMPEDPYNSMIFNEAAFSLMGLEICGIEPAF